MCGICGTLHLDFEKPARVETVRRMADQMVHRGPDAEGFFADGPVALGARRLAIIDVASGHQPRENENKTVHVVFNGEIYNHAALRERLVKKGHVFCSRSDTEVLVHLWEERGPEMPEDLCGMFALALWDAPARTLFLARDRLGEKPLYYHADAGRLVFASEIKTLLAAGDIPVRLDPQAVHDYLTLRFTPSPATGFSGIHKLPPAHWLLAKPGGWTVRRYWDIPDFSPKGGQSLAENARTLSVLLDRAVAGKLESEVPLGAMLSGGMDSSAVVAGMRSAGHARISTYTVDYPEPGPHSEAAYARLAARAFQTDHHEILVPGESFSAGVSETVRILEEPLADMAAHPVLALSRESRATVTVLMTGTGGDELFGGYPVYREAALGALLSRLPGHLWERLVLPAAGFLPKGFPGKNFVRRARVHPKEVFLGSSCVYGSLDEEAKRALYTKDFAGALDFRPTGLLCRETMERAKGATALQTMAYCDTMLWLPDSHLIMTDKCSMAASIETRSPLLDHGLAEWAARLPDACRRTLWESKVVFRRAMRDRLPRAILKRKKRGFSTPIHLWLKAPDNPMERMLLEPDARTRVLFRQAPIRTLFSRHRAGDGDQSAVLYTLVVLEQWMREFFG
jgi:asparagine synthase (glutamine-hydrolysing)